MKSESSISLKLFLRVEVQEFDYLRGAVSFEQSLYNRGSTYRILNKNVEPTNDSSLADDCLVVPS